MTSRVLLFLPKFRILKFGSWEQDKTEKFFASNDTYEDKYYYGAYGSWGDYVTYPYGSTRVYGNGLSGRTYYTSSGDGVVPVEEDKKIVPVKSSWIIDEDGFKKESRFMYSIIVNAKDYTHAEDEMYQFLDDFYQYVTDEDLPFETLQEIDTEMWEFCVETDRDVEYLIKFPYTVGYKYDYSTVEEEGE